MSEEELQNLKSQLTQLLTDSKAQFDSISKIAADASKKESEINDSNARVIELRNGGETEKTTISSLANEAAKIKTDLDGIQSKASEIIAALSTKQQELDGHYNSFMAKSNDTELSKLEKMNATVLKAQQDGENIDRIHTKLKDYESFLFGNKDANTFGLKDLIDGYETEIKKNKEAWEESYKALYNKIEGLLPGATSTGLSKAYQDQGKKYFWPYWGWSAIFMATTLGMIYFALKTLHDAETVSEAFIKIISRAPFFVPAIWLAIFSSKQQSQSRRLQEEYAHKEALSKSYESYKRETEKLPDSPDKLKLSEKLVETMVNMASDNPSHTLQLKHHNDKPPILSGLFNRDKAEKSNNTQK